MADLITSTRNASDIIHNELGRHRLTSTRFTTKSFEGHRKEEYSFKLHTNLILTRYAFNMSALTLTGDTL